MTNIIVFPEKMNAQKNKTESKSFSIERTKISKAAKFREILRTILFLMWPFIRWFVYFDWVLVFFKMIFHAGQFATLNFILHSFIILSTMWFVLSPLKKIK